TLQDIYSKIADIYEKFCDGLEDSDPVTMITEQLTISETAWTTNGLTFDNPDADGAIGTAQLEINSVLAIALQLAKDEVSFDDATMANAQGDIVPIPKGSPIMLLPKLIKLLVLYKAPLKFLMNVILDYIKDVILEHIKRKLVEKNAEIYQCVDIASSQLIKIPKEAKQIILSFSNLPDWIGKRFEPANLNKSIITPSPPVVTDMSKFILSALGTIQIGFQLTGSGVAGTVFWDIDTRLEYYRQYIQLPEYEFVNYQRFAYIHLNYENTCNLCFLRV
ncbi:hypothetical protein B9G53_14275, partial [Pseudanabaena sp. SR411]|uniref:hypothetical protein n=1 Tax=Pseudanabaena sp. SR411 TaxID=1980935 RepID=UPI000BD17616